MLGQRRRRWANIKTSLFQRVVFAGIEPIFGQHRAGVADGGPTLILHWLNISGLLGIM